MSTKTTIETIYRRDKARVVNSIKGMLFKEYQWAKKVPFHVRGDWAEDIFCEAIVVLQKKFPHITDFSYHQSEKLLYSIAKLEVRRFALRHIQEISQSKGTYHQFRIWYNARGREFKKLESQRRTNRRGAKKHYYVITKVMKANNPEKCKKFNDNRNKRRREVKLQKKLGTFIDTRFFNPNNPTKKWRHK